MQVNSSTQSLSLLKAQQALEARRASKTNVQKPSVEVDIVPSAPARASRVQVNTPEAPMPSMPSAGLSRWEKTVQEVQSIAERAGYLGVTERDIRRAYSQGESLLADYRV